MLGIGTKGGSPSRSAAELVTLAISVALLAVIVGGLVALELTRGSARPRIVVQPQFDDVYRFRGDWYLPLRITNEGDESTDQLRIDVEREIPGEDPEEIDLEYTFVAGGEEVAGYAVFADEPTEANTTVDVVGITEP